MAWSIASVGQERDPLETVMVSAQKRPRALQNVPISVTTLTANDLSQKGLVDLTAIAERYPTLDAQRSVSAITTTLRIRRIGNLGNIPTFEPAVGLFVDGAYRSRSMLGSGDLLDVDRIEVLNGPQSALYGKNASAGVVAVYTRRPGSTFVGRGELTLGQIDSPLSPTLSRASMALELPVSATLRTSLAAATARQGHVMRNQLVDGADGNERSRSTVRAQLLWSPSDRLEVRLLAGYLTQHDDEGESDVVFVPGTGSTNILRSLQRLGLAGTCPSNEPHDLTSCSVSTNRLALDTTDVTLIGDYRFANGMTLTSISSWDSYHDVRNEDDVVQLLAPLLYFQDSEEGASLQEELRLTSGDAARWQWLAGIFYYHNDYARGSHGDRPMFGPVSALAFDPVWPSLVGLPLAVPGQLGLHDSRQQTDYLGVFGQSSIELTQHLSLTAGLRWQTEHKDASLSNSVTAPGVSLISRSLTPAVTPAGAPVNGVLARTSNSINWSLTPQWQLDDDLMMYASVTRATKSGGFNTGFGSAPLSTREFGDEDISSYELGTRTSLAQGRIHLNATGFWTTYRHYQDASFVSAQFAVGNVDRLGVKGFELEGRALLGAHTRADLELSYADARYVHNTSGMCSPGRTPDGDLPGSCDLSGEHPIDAPPWAIHLGLEHRRPLRTNEWFARLDWAWTDRYFTSFSADPRLVQAPSHDIDVRIGARIADRYEVILSADNVLDEEIVDIESVLNFFNDTSYQSYVQASRRYAITLRATF